jgi:nitrogen fixation-related uncharacterized protein
MSLPDNKSMNKMGERIYDESANVGSVIASGSLIITIIISLVLVAIAVAMLLNDSDDQYVDLEGTIVEPNCTKTNVQDKNILSCNLHIRHKYNEKNYEAYLHTTSIEYKKEQNIKIRVNKNNPTDISLPSNISTRLSAGILISVALIMPVCAGVNYWLTKKSKLYAAGQGANTMWNVIT